MKLWHQTWALSLRYMCSSPVSALLHVLLLSLGLGSITMVLLVSDQIDRAFARDVQGIDLVVGAKGSPLQLILAGVFHIDAPPGNIPLAEVQSLQRHPLVAQVIPLSLGDSMGGYRIVGTTADYLTHYQATLSQGQVWAAPMQAVLGAQVAQRSGLALGAQFLGTHGLGAGGHAHGDTPYQVVGLLAPCQCVLDRLVLTALESVWHVHEHALATDQDDLQALKQEREVTLTLLRYRSPMAAVTLPRLINASTPLQAAAPALELTRLLRLLGVGTEVLRGFGVLLLLAAGLSVFIALWSAVRERRADLALLRLLGAPPARVATLLLCEALWLALLATVCGLLAGHMGAEFVGWLLEADRSLPITGWYVSPKEWLVPLLAVAVATLAASLPVLTAYRFDVAELLKTR